MSKEVLRIQFVNVKDCFLHFSPSTSKNFRGHSVCALKLESNGKFFYFSAYHSPCSSLSGTDLVGISPTYARLLGFKENDIVVISSVNNIGSLKQLKVNPASDDDLEILLSAGEAIETSLLNQLRIVWPKQIFCAWVAPNIAVTLVVDSLCPNLSYGRLEEYSEVVIGDAVKTKGTDHHAKENESLPMFDEECELEEKILICRCIISTKASTRGQPYVIILSSDSTPEWIVKLVNEKGEKLFWTIQNLYENEKNESELLRLQLKFEDNINIGNDVAGYKSLIISQILHYKLGLENGSKVLLKPVEEVVEQRDQIAGFLVTPYFKDNEENIISALRRSLFESIVKNGSLLLNTKAEFALSDGRIAALTLRPLNLNWAILSVSDLADLTISINEFLNVPIEWPERLETSSIAPVSLIRIFDKILYQAELALIVSLGLNNSKRNPLFFDNLLLTGRSGCGKTTLAKCLLHRISGPPYFLFTKVIDCHQLKGKRIEIFSKLLLEILIECHANQPSVLFFDNLDIIAGVPKTDHENTEATLHLNRVSFKIIELIEEFQRDGRIAVIATADSVEQINKNLFSKKGETLFTSNIDIPTLSKNDRLELLKLIIDEKIPNIQKNFDDNVLNEIAKQTEGFAAADFVKFLDKALFESCQRKAENGREALQITKNDLDAALTSSKPSLLHGINLTKQLTTVFTNIGGLHAAKEKLTEIILWPLLYPEIMNQCPLKAQNAVLLYGMPGTGKTLLANAVAGESKLNFIVVKGPELMSKYIGQSEEGVRKIFEKAKAAKPCLLFFDEFDSLAPRRGQEQTGVTDRVVNQLLTALDGVEPLTGVSVLAATSRPDLIDKALLRPGRIGASVYCSLPNLEERLDILEILCTNIQVSNEVDLLDIAKKTEGYSGADIKGLLTSAQIKLIDGFVAKSLEDGINIENILPSSFERDNKWSLKLELEHINLALKESKPSISFVERLKFEQIYREFQNPTPPDVSSLKVTFA